MTTTPPPGRDRLRELLDAVLADEARDLGGFARAAYASPHHLAHRVRREAGEPPVALRRRVELERASWRLRRGERVTDVAFAAGYDSVEGFARAYARAYGHPPSTTPVGPAARDAHWLPAPNGVHFHPPAHLWRSAGEDEQAPAAVGDPTALMVRHALDDQRALLVAGAALGDQAWRAPRQAPTALLPWDGPEASVGDVLHAAVRTLEVWTASLAGEDHPPDPRPGDGSPAAAPDLLARHDAVAPRWLDLLRDVARRGAWGDVVVDALCDPPESFVVGSVVAHVLEYAAHRRLLVRRWLAADGLVVEGGGDHGDPIDWLRRGADHPETPEEPR